MGYSVYKHNHAKSLLWPRENYVMYIHLRGSHETELGLLSFTFWLLAFGFWLLALILSIEYFIEEETINSETYKTGNLLHISYCNR